MMVNIKLTSIYRCLTIYCLLLMRNETNGLHDHRLTKFNGMQEINDVKQSLPNQDHASSKQLELAQEQFIGIFGMTRVPKPRRYVYIPQYMLDRYHAWRKNLKNEKTSGEKFIQALHHDEEKSTTSKYGNKAVLYFPMTHLKDVDRNIFRSADLHLRKINPNLPKKKSNLMTTTLLRYLKKCNYSDCLEEEQIKIPSRPHLSTASWDVFNVTDAVSDWLNKPNDHLGLSISTWGLSNQYHSKNQTIYHLDNKKPIKLIAKQWEKKRPFIVLHFDKSDKSDISDKTEGKHVRKKRQIPTTNHHKSSTDQYRDESIVVKQNIRDMRKIRGRKLYKSDKMKKQRNLKRQPPMESTRVTKDRRLHSKAKKHACRKRPMYLNFNAVGWSEWIIAPAGYDVFYCSGICPKPLGPHYNTTNHAVIQNQVNSFDPQLVPAPCCIPTELEAITILYLNEQSQITLKNYQQMAVVGCGCR